MSKSSISIVSYVVILLCAIAVSRNYADEMRVVERDSLSMTIPNFFGETPILEFNDQNGRYLGIHIPWLYDGKFHWREGQGLFGNQVDVNILSGLSHYTWDKSINPETGDLQGPFKYSILGLTLWDNGEQPVATPPPPAA